MLTIDRKELQAALNVAAKCVQGIRFYPNPAQGSIRIEWADGIAKLSASDLEYREVGYTFESATVNGSGAVLVDPKRLKAALKPIKADRVTIVARSEDNSYILTLRADGIEIDIRGYDSDTWESIPPVGCYEPTGEAVFDAPALSKAIEQTRFAMLRDETRPVLHAIFMQIGPTGAKLVATDTYRLARAHVSRIDTNAAGRTDALILPLPAVELLAPLLRRATCGVTIAYGPVEPPPDKPEWAQERDLRCFASVAEVSWGNWLFRTRLIEGRYPRYERVLPAEYAAAITVGRSELIEALQKLQPLAGEDGYRVVFRPSEKLEIIAESPDVGTARATVPAIANGEVPEIGLNCRYLLEALNALEGDTVTLGFNGPNTAFGIGDYYVQMPMQILKRSEAAGVPANT